MHIKLIGFIIPFFFLTNKETIKNEIIALNKKYYSVNSFNMDITTNAYDPSTGALLKTSKMTIIQTPDKFFTKDDLSESMANLKYKVSIHNRKKLIAISELASKSPDESKKSLEIVSGNNYALKLDTILDFYKDIQFRDLGNSKRELTFFFKEGNIRQSIVIYDKTNYRVSEVQMILLDRGKELKYALKYDYHGKETITKDIFNEGKYFTFKKGKIVLNEKYADYKLIYNK